MNTRPLFVLLSGLALVSCGDDAPEQPPAPKKARGSLAAAATAAAAGSAVPAASNAKRSPPPPKRDFAEADFTETERSRDPFRSFARSFATEDEEEGRGSQREVLLKDYAVDELKLIGIVTRVTPARAMLVDPTGRGHVVKRGQFIGRADLVRVSGQSGTTYELNWRLDSIRDGDVVLVREDPNNPDVPAATKVIPLRPEASVVE
jgi:type IV pilus assembly protein PilP